MTNMYGTGSQDPEAGHDETLHHENDVVREPPSDYEFSDEHSAIVAEEHTEDTSSETLGAEGKSSRRSAVLPIVAAVGCLILLAVWRGGNLEA